MFEFIEMIEPYVAGVCLALWEAYAGCCLWMAVKSDSAAYTPTDRGYGTISRGMVRDHGTARSRLTHVLTTNA